MGTQRESASRKRKVRYKQNTGMAGKSAMQREAVMWIEIKVEKSVSQLSRKAAIVYIVPVP